MLQQRLVSPIALSEAYKKPQRIATMAAICLRGKSPDDFYAIL